MSQTNETSVHVEEQGRPSSHDATAEMQHQENGGAQEKKQTESASNILDSSPPSSGAPEISPFSQANNIENRNRNTDKVFILSFILPLF